MLHPVAIVVLGLTLYMSYRLYAGNRRTAYRLLLVSHTLFILDHLLHLWRTKTAAVDPWLAGFATDALRTIAFIFVNFAVFALYHPLRRRTRLWFYGLLAAAALVVAAALAEDGSPLAGAFALPDSWSLPGRELLFGGYLLLLCPLFTLMIAPLIRQPRKYVIGLGVWFAAELASLAGRPSLPAARGRWLDTAIDWLPIVYYILLFMLLFERVVDLLMSAYRSSIVDGLTGLYNRRFILARLEKALKRGQALGVIFCDIDNFKKLNDTSGHDKADLALKRVANVLMEETAGIGLAGRYGGEELVAFVLGDAGPVAEQIRARIERETGVTVSVGVCAAEPGMTAGQLLKRADQAMYHSKTNGKNRVTDYAELARALNAPSAAGRRARGTDR